MIFMFQPLSSLLSEDNIFPLRRTYIGHNFSCTEKSLQYNSKNYSGSSEQTEVYSVKVEICAHFSNVP